MHYHLMFEDQGEMTVGEESGPPVGAEGKS